MDSNTKIRVVIADDHPMMRRGLRSVLELDASFDVAGEAGSFHELMGLLETIVADVVLLDLGRMGTPPITMVSSLSRSHPNVAIIIYSSTLSGAREFVKTGARGYIAKEDWEEEVVTAIFAVLRGEIFFSPTVIDYLERAGAARKNYKLAPKEWDVLRLIAEGCGTQDIMAQLTLAKQTVINYVQSLYRKTGCSERTQLAEWYRRHAAIDR